MSKTVQQQITALRDDAGSQYVEAATRYIETWIRLRSIDLAITSRDVGLPYEPATFATPPTLSIHGEYMPNAHEIHARAHDRAKAACEWLIVGMAYMPKSFVGRPELPVHAEFLPDAAALYERASERAQAALEPMINSVIND